MLIANEKQKVMQMRSKKLCTDLGSDLVPLKIKGKSTEGASTLITKVLRHDAHCLNENIHEGELALIYWMVK